LRIFVTVGMGPWPFDRLIGALGPLCAEHEVFAQTGTSTVQPPCPHEPFVGWSETQRRLAGADAVITHAGNTVRLVQRMGKVPIAVARECARGEMRNDHQVHYLAAERGNGRVVALDGDLADLTEALAVAVSGHPEAERALLAVAPPLPRLDPDALAGILGQIEAVAGGAGWAQAQRGDPHHDLSGGPPPPGATLGSLAMTWPDAATGLAEAARALRPGGTLLLTGARDRHRALAALTAAGFTPRWCDGEEISASRTGGELPR
jgi:UDP-N-acetylglucosamine transferase subunit ALG13